MYFFYPERKEDKDLFTFQAGGQHFDFIQRYLTGPKNLLWRKVAGVIFNQAGRLGLNSALFLMDSSKLQCSGLTTFYKGLFKVWDLLEKRR